LTTINNIRGLIDDNRDYMADFRKLESQIRRKKIAILDVIPYVCFNGVISGDIEYLDISFQDANLQRTSFGHTKPVR